MPSNEMLEALTKSYADAREGLAIVMREVEDERRRVLRRRLATIKRLAAAATAAKEELARAIEDSPEQFKRPRTMLFHGIRVGFAKGKGKVSFADEAGVVKLIRKHFPEKFDVLVKTTEKPLKDPLAQLTVDELKKIGCSVTDAGDQVVIKAADNEIDKLVDALLADPAIEQSEAA